MFSFCFLQSIAINQKIVYNGFCRFCRRRRKFSIAFVAE